METIRHNDRGPAVSDVQERLVTAGYLSPEDAAAAGSVFDEATVRAVEAFCAARGLPATGEVDDAVWNALVDASFELGDRTLYLRMPYFHGNDVRELQSALGNLGFNAGGDDGIFGAHTEAALRRFQINMGLPSDGIAGAYTMSTILNLHHIWKGKQPSHESRPVGFARAADVLENNALCLFGTQEFTRNVAARMSNLALATNPASKIVSAESLLVKPDESMLLVHIVLPEDTTAETTPRVQFDGESMPTQRLKLALAAARRTKPHRIAVELPGPQWEDAGESRSAQHFAISLLDALCEALQ